MGIAQQLPADAPRRNHPPGDDVIPEAHHWRRARELVQAADVDGVYTVAEVLADTYPDDLPQVVYCLTRIAADVQQRRATPQPLDDTPVRLGRPRLPSSHEWTEEEAKEAHRLYARGDKTPWVREGQRAYSRLRKQAQRNARRA